MTIVRMSVLIETDSGVRYVDWKGGSVKAIKAAARGAYPGAYLKFGRPTFHQSFGAH